MPLPLPLHRMMVVRCRLSQLRATFHTPKAYVCVCEPARERETRKKEKRNRMLIITTFQSHSVVNLKQSTRVHHVDAVHITHKFKINHQNTQSVNTRRQFEWKHHTRCGPSSTTTSTQTSLSSCFHQNFANVTAAVSLTDTDADDASSSRCILCVCSVLCVSIEKRCEKGCVHVQRFTGHCVCGLNWWPVLARRTS